MQGLKENMEMLKEEIARLNHEHNLAAKEKTTIDRQLDALRREQHQLNNVGFGYSVNIIC